MKVALIVLFAVVAMAYAQDPYIDPAFSQPSIHDNQGGYQQPNIDPAFVNPPYQYDPQDQYARGG